ncbi:MAG TPA: hypothetical protein VMH86_03525 [Rhizomicrobium sp.]|nr:hypothetical protein [Rhizomicrobium sp.]
MPKTLVRFKPIRISASSTVEKKRIKNQRGKSAVQFELDSDRPDFVRKLITVFSLNVVAARRANSGVSIKRFSPHSDETLLKTPLQRQFRSGAKKKRRKKKKAKA